MRFTGVAPSPDRATEPRGSARASARPPTPAAQCDGRCAIDADEIAMPRTLDPCHRHIEGEHPDAPTFCNIQSKPACPAPPTADSVTEPRPCGCRADRLAAGPCTFDRCSPRPPLELSRARLTFAAWDEWSWCARRPP